MRKGVAVIVGLVAIVAIALVVIYAIDVDVQDPGALPTANIDVEGGRMPSADVDTADVSVGSAEREVRVPDVDVTTEERRVDLPTVDVEPADTDRSSTN